MKTLDTKDPGFPKAFARLTDRFTTIDRAVTERTTAIVGDVRKNGDRALFAWTEKLDRVRLTSRTARVSAARMEKAENEIPPKLKRAIKTAYANIKKFHLRQRETSWRMKVGASTVGQMITPLSRVGLYVPGGSASYPSSVLMNALPAIVAGVKEIVVCSPAPDGVLNPAVRYAARLCGIGEFYTVGGAQAVAAMAYGTKTIRRVDKIVGPGNAYVAEAKRAVFGTVDIDMIAGSSEIAIVADAKADPAWCAADILSQAEHDALALPVLLSPSAKLCNKVAKEVQRQVALLERSGIARECIEKKFTVVKTRSVGEAIDLVNDLAPEHLQLMFAGAEKAVGRIKNAGAIFVGGYSPEALGDYMAGPNHVLPTSGSARFFSPLGVYDFIKRTSVINYAKKDFLSIARRVANLAEAEGLTAHARAALMRLGR